MEWFECYDIAERYHKIINPSSPEKIIRAGEVAEMHSGSRVIEFGCGFAEPLALWGERFGISGLGIEFRAYACRRADQRLRQAGLQDRIQIVQANGAEYPFEQGAYDVAACIGASFIWKGYRETIRAMRPALSPGGRMIIGEPYWLTDQVPPEYVAREKIHTEAELLRIARDEGFTFEYVLHSNGDEWDAYEASNWRGFCAWLRENPSHPDRDEVIRTMNQWQEDYLHFGRKYLGWAIFVLTSV